MATVVLGNAKTLEFRHYFRQHLVEPVEWFGAAPEGNYDIGEFLKTLPAPFNQPDLVLVFLFGRPVNLAGVKCPKVLIIGDTHHQVRPITNVLLHALAEPYDLILGQYARQHLHFFHEVGLSQTVWIPCFLLNPFEMQPATKCRPTLFIGDISIHPYRRLVFETLYSKGIEVPVGRVAPQYAALEYSRTQVNVNVSLNGDLNLRVFEILAAHGFLITDRLSPESGLEMLFQDHHHLRLFDSADHLHEIFCHYLAHPSEADAIAAQGHAQYLRQHTPPRKIQQLRDALAGKIEPELSLDLDLRTRLPREPLPRVEERVRLYECLQEVHRNNAQLPVLFWEGLEREAIDAVDLPRLKVSLLARSGASSVDACGLQTRIERLHVSLDSLGGRGWAIVCVPPTALHDPLFHRAIQHRAMSYILVPHYDPQVHATPFRALIEKYHLNHHEPSFPPLLSLCDVPMTFTQETLAT